MIGKQIISRCCLLIILSVAVCGCGKETDYGLENKNWMFTYVQDGTNGDIVLCAEDKKEFYPDVAVGNLNCVVENGFIILTDEEGNTVYTLKYESVSKNADSQIYNIMHSDEMSSNIGKAVVATTDYKGQPSETTLLISIDNKSICFTHESIETK